MHCAWIPSNTNYLVDVSGNPGAGRFCMFVIVCCHVEIHVVCVYSMVVSAYCYSEIQAFDLCGPVLNLWKSELDAEVRASKSGVKAGLKQRLPVLGLLMF